MTLVQTLTAEAERDHGLEPGAIGRRRRFGVHVAARHQVIQRLRDKGWSQLAIADGMGLDPCTVHKALKSRAPMFKSRRTA